jgi:hypothetical protein
MGEVRNTLTRGSVKMDLLQSDSKLRNDFHGKKYEELSAAEQYQCDRDYEELVTRRIEKSEMIKDMDRLVEVLTTKGEARRKDRDTMASAMKIVEYMVNTQPPERIEEPPKKEEKKDERSTKPNPRNG